jgi:sugar lactone lactonase YvrE
MFGGIAVRKNLLCLAYADARGRVCLFDLDEARLMSFWEYGLETGYADAGGVAMTADFAIYVADTRNDQVRVFTPFGIEVGRLGLPHDAPPGAARRDRPGVLDRPRAVAVHADVAYVACGEHELRRGVQRFTRDGGVLEPLRAFGDVEGSFGAPRGVHADVHGVLVADTLHGAVQRFDARGRFVGHFSTARAPGTASRPVAVVRLPDGDVLVADQGDMHGLARFSVHGEARAEVEMEVELIDPVDLACDERGRVYVLDRDGERVHRLLPDLRVERLVVDLAEFR